MGIINDHSDTLKWKRCPQNVSKFSRGPIFDFPDFTLIFSAYHVKKKQDLTPLRSHSSTFLDGPLGDEIIPKILFNSGFGILWSGMRQQKKHFVKAMSDLRSSQDLTPIRSHSSTFLDGPLTLLWVPVFFL